MHVFFALKGSNMVSSYFVWRYSDDVMATELSLKTCTNSGRRKESGSDARACVDQSRFRF